MLRDLCAKSRYAFLDFFLPFFLPFFMAFLGSAAGAAIMNDESFGPVAPVCKVASFEASCFDGRYITGDVSVADFDAMQTQRRSQQTEEDDPARSRLALQNTGD